MNEGNAVNIVGRFSVSLPPLGGPKAVRVHLSIYDLVEICENLPPSIQLDASVEQTPQEIEFLLDQGQTERLGQELLEAADLLRVQG